MKIKNIVLILVLSFVFQKISAQTAKVEIMHYPKKWKFEKISFPLDFAKDITWKGFEELRFSPGMFKVESKEYFTYYFGMKVEEKTVISEETIKDMLEKYYRGLCKAVNSQGKFKIDYEKIVVKVSRKDAQTFKISVVFFDSFTNGKQVLLSMLLTTKKKNNATMLLASVTPKINEGNLTELHQKNLEFNFK